jgi:hypothetical protein
MRDLLLVPLRGVAVVGLTIVYPDGAWGRS